MTDNWELAFDGTIEDRPVQLFRYGTTNELKALTTQKGNENTGLVVDEDSITFPLCVNDGDPIEISGSNPDDLELNLKQCGFSKEGAKEIARHGRVVGT